MSKNKPAWWGGLVRTDGGKLLRVSVKYSKRDDQRYLWLLEEY